jgi:hypothetical protein
MAVTVCVWTGVVFFVQSIASSEAARVVDTQNAQQSSTQQSTLVRMHAMAQDTAQDRARLDQLLTVDVGAAATMLQNVGKTTDVTVKLSGALPELPPPGTPSGPQIQAVGFAVQADGTFAALMRTEQLFETLPLASSIERFDIQRAPGTGGPGTDVWHMSAYIRVLTTSDISS